MNEMCATLVKAGIFEGEGSFGYVQIDGVKNDAAADRYTYIKLSDLYWDLIGDLLKDVPYMESPNGNPEPEYLPLPLPALHTKTISQGL
jgi:DNA gyrase/topoisomerase IV subunit A